MKDSTIGDFVSLIRGKTYKSKLLGQSGPVLLGLASISRNGGFRNDKLRTYGGESDPRHILQPGDLFVSLKDVTQKGDLLGSVARVPSNVSEGRLTQDTVKLEFNKQRISRSYLYWLLQAPQYRAYCRSRSMGTTNLSLSRDDFLSFPVPSLSIQRSNLVKLFDDLEKSIENNRKMNETLEAMAQAIFKSWFIDFDPVIDNALRAGNPIPADLEDKAARRSEVMARDDYKKQPYAHLFPDHFVDSDLGSIPAGWEVRALVSLCSKIGSGATPRGGSKSYLPEGINLIRSQNVYDSEFVWSGLVHISDEAAEKLKNVIVKENDVLLNITGASFLRTCVVEPSVLPARVNQHVAIVRAQKGIPPNFIHQHLLSPQVRSYLRGLDAGASRQAITKGHIESVNLVLPSEKLLTLFKKNTDPMFEKKSANRSESRTLASLRDTLLPKLISGEIRVPEIEGLVAL